MSLNKLERMEEKLEKISGSIEELRRLYSYRSIVSNNVAVASTFGTFLIVPLVVIGSFILILIFISVLLFLGISKATTLIYLTTLFATSVYAYWLWRYLIFKDHIFIEPSFDPPDDP